MRAVSSKLLLPMAERSRAAFWICMAPSKDNSSLKTEYWLFMISYHADSCRTVKVMSSDWHFIKACPISNTDASVPETIHARRRLLINFRRDQKALIKITSYLVKSLARALLSAISSTKKNPSVTGYITLLAKTGATNKELP